MNAMKIDWAVAPLVNFDHFAGDWDELNCRCGNLPILDSQFLTPLLEVFPPRTGTVIAFGRSGGKLVACTILSPKGVGQWESYQPSQLPLGPWLLAPGLDAGDALHDLLNGLPGIRLAVGLTQIDPRFVPRPKDSATLQTLDYIQTAWVDLGGDFEAYWAARGKNLRQNMKKQRNKLEADGRACRLEVIRDTAGVAGAIDDYGALESASWKAGGGTAIATDNAQGRFYRSMLEKFCAAGRGAIYRYLIGDKVAAMDLCVESNDLLVILKTTYDGADKTLSPAFLMRETQFAQLFAERRIRRIEFYGKLMEWHTRWTDEARALYHANGYKTALIPKVLSWRRKLARPDRAALTDA